MNGADSGNVVAVTRHEPVDIQRRLGVQFRPGFDDLDSVQWAPLGKGYLLVRHDGAPVPGTEIVTTKVPSQVPMSEIMLVTGLAWEEFSWVHPDVDHGC